MAGPATPISCNFIPANRNYSPLWLLVAWLLAPLDPIIVALTVIGVGGRRRWDTPRRRKRGLIIILGGVEGPSLYARAMATGILRSGWRGAVHVYRWNAGIPLFRVFPNLMHGRHHRRSAAGLLELIRDQRARFGDTPISILAQSGGCWIAVRTLEELEGADAINRAVLLGPSIWPGYDPARAARGCRGGMVSIGGPGDFFFLGLGTTTFGTSDRHFGPSAGLLGWRREAEGFADVRWRPDWLRFGYVGNHITAVSPAFIRHVVAPWLTGVNGVPID